MLTLNRGSYHLLSRLMFFLIVACICVCSAQEVERKDWLSSGFSLQRYSQNPYDWTGFFYVQSNSVVLSKKLLISYSDFVLRHEFAHAWHFNVIMNTPDLDHEYIEAADSWTFPKCQNDLDCRIREKFDEYRENGVLSDLVLEENPNTNTNFRDNKICWDGASEPDRDLHHYAECNPIEFFAVITEAFTSVCGKPPYDREGLKDMDEELYDLMKDAWNFDPDIETNNNLEGPSLVDSSSTSQIEFEEPLALNETNKDEKDWLTVTVSINRDERIQASYNVVSNGINLGKDEFLSPWSFLEHQIARAWYHNVIRDTPAPVVLWNAEEKVYYWDDCQNDLECRIRSKFDEYRDNAKLSDLWLENWPNPSHNYRDRAECQEQGADPGRDMYHYAECNPDRFFAAISEIFMNTKPWRPPFDRQGLKDFDDELYDLMKEAWNYDPDIEADQSDYSPLIHHDCIQH